MWTFNPNQGLRGLKDVYTCIYLEHDVMKDVVGEHFSLSTLMLEVVPKLPNNSCNGLSSSFGKGGLVLLEEGVQVDLLQQFWKGKVHH